MSRQPADCIPVPDPETGTAVAVDTPPRGVWAPEVRRLTVGLTLTITLVAFEALAIAAVMPIVEEDLGGIALYGWVFSGFFLASLLGIVVSGHSADRLGPALPFGVGLLLLAAGLLGGGSARSMPVLVAARVLQGLGAGAIPATAYAAVGRCYPPSARPRVFAVFSTAWVVPGVVGPALAILLAHAVSWRAVFLSLLPLVVLAGAMTIPPLRAAGGPHRDEGGPSSDQPAYLRRAVLLVLGAGAVLAAATGPPLPLAVLLAAAGLPLTIWAFMRLTPPGTLRLRPGLPATVGVRGILTCAFFSTDAYVSLVVTHGRGASALLAGFALTAAAIMWTAGAWIQERRLAPDGPRRLDTLGFTLLLAGILTMLGVALGLPVWCCIPAWGLGGLGTGLAYAPLSVTVLAAAEPGAEGSASAALQLSDMLGVALGTGFGGALVTFGDSLGWPRTAGVALAFAASALVAAVGILAARRLPAFVPGASSPST